MLLARPAKLIWNVVFVKNNNFCNKLAGLRQGFQFRDYKRHERPLVIFFLHTRFNINDLIILDPNARLSFNDSFDTFFNRFPVSD